MADIFADTGYWIALINERDQGHDKAIQVRTNLARERIVTSEMVLIELLNYASRRGATMRTLAAETAAALARDSEIIVVAQSSEQYNAALQRYRARPDQAWSLVDCASFMIMEERDIREALAFDRHFEQAGFTALLRNRD